MTKRGILQGVKNVEDDKSRETMQKEPFQTCLFELKDRYCSLE